MSFRVGDFALTLLSIQIKWSQRSDIGARKKDVEAISQWIYEIKSNAIPSNSDVLVIGDFNMLGLRNKGFKLLEKYGLKVPNKLRNFKTKLKQNAHYDHIAYLQENIHCDIGRAGVFDFYDAFFVPNKTDNKYESMTFQLSDHLPLWVEFRVRETGIN